MHEQVLTTGTHLYRIDGFVRFVSRGMAERVQSVVVGAGVVGLAVSRALARRGREVLLVEALPQIGSATSSRNSGVVHAGIYYPQGSLKATTCVQGRKALYRFCEEEGVAHARCGKLILATSQAQISSLQGIATKAKANGVVGSDELLLLTAEEAREKEPLVSCCGALFSPSTGIVDVHEFMLALLGSAEAHGASLALSTPVVGGSTEGGLRLLTPGLELQCDQIVNCAGHGAPGLARQLGVSAPVQHWAKGNYFSLQGASPFTHLIYPLPSEAGLGIHATLDLAGRCRFGPDVEWLLPQPGGELDYQVSTPSGKAIWKTSPPRSRHRWIPHVQRSSTPRCVSTGQPYQTGH